MLRAPVNASLAPSPDVGASSPCTTTPHERAQYAHVTKKTRNREYISDIIADIADNQPYPAPYSQARASPRAGTPNVLVFLPFYLLSEASWWSRSSKLVETSWTARDWSHRICTDRLCRLPSSKKVCYAPLRTVPRALLVSQSHIPASSHHPRTRLGKS